MLGCLDFSQPFDLETETLLWGLGAILSQKEMNGQSHIISYTGKLLKPNEQLICNYSLAKLELLALKWAVTEKMRDCLLDLKFMVGTNINPLVFI